jgi:hypothetical protein
VWLQVVYPINMLYWGPLGVWAYWQIVVRPSKRKPKDNSHGGACHAHSAKRPMWQSVAVSVAHCGAGCVLGDIVADWIVYGAGWTIAGRAVWLEMILGYGLALLFGIAFQYLNIAPMTGEWGLDSFIKAVKADILSLTSFEVGLFGWMAIYNLTFYSSPELTPVSSIYWFMMQIGMLFGKATSSPTNWWLVKTGIKQPCA